MSAFTFSSGNWSPGVGAADAAALTNGAYMAIQGAAGTQRTNLLEVLIEGESTASAVTYLLLSHDSTIGVTAAALVTPNSNGPNDPSTGALANPVVAGISFTTPPQRSNSITTAKLRLSLNTFGGIIKWNPWQPNMAYAMLGNTQPLGETSLSAFTGSSASSQVSAHIMYETA